MRLLLHACCGPCALEPVQAFLDEGIDFALEYANSNIHPAEEYEHRRSTLVEHVVRPQGLDLIEAPYDPDEWEACVGIYGTDREKRCRACYRLRFEQAARDAREHDYDTLSTTLTISPYQFTSIIFEELERAAAAADLQALCRDWRSLYPASVRDSRAKGMYRQNYCGCRFSQAEAAAQRAVAKAERDAAKRLKHEALVWSAAEGCCNQESQL